MKLSKYLGFLNSQKREDSSNTKNFKLLIYALLIGLTVGLIGSAFRISLSYVDQFRAYIFDLDNFENQFAWLLPLVFSITCISIGIYLVRKFAPEASGSGIHEIEGALDGVKKIKWKRILPIKFIASLFSLGSGLLLGREGPTIQIGASIGKMVKDVFQLDNIDDNPMVSTGSAAGLSAAFNAPFSGIIFVIEEMQGHFKFNLYSVAAIMIGAASSDIVVRSLIDSNPSIIMPTYQTPEIDQYGIFIILGLFFSLVGLIYNKLLIKALDFGNYFNNKPVIFIALLTGSIITITGIFYPNIIGGGYELITNLLTDSYPIMLLGLFFIGRLLLSVFSYGTGAPGGIFAPLLSIGVVFGVLFETTLKILFPELDIPPGVFAIAGMAAVFASTVMAPLTGLVLAIEMTSNYEMILPLIITTVTTTVFTALLGNKPIYSTLLQRSLKPQ